MELFTPTISLVFYSGLLLALGMMLYRLVRGPHVLDRILCVDAIALITICLIVVWEVEVKTRYLFDSVLVLAVLGFLTTVALTKYLERGDIID
jgi:multicomponent K+:H+ antiporter subunit F